jgi:hypothetical protein
MLCIWGGEHWGRGALGEGSTHAPPNAVYPRFFSTVLSSLFKRVFSHLYVQIVILFLSCVFLFFLSCVFPPQQSERVGPRDRSRPPPRPACRHPRRFGRRPARDNHEPLAGYLPLVRYSKKIWGSEREGQACPCKHEPLAGQKNNGTPLFLSIQNEP